MNATQEELTLLEVLAQLDLSYAQDKKKLEELPQRAQILAARKKIAEYEKKKEVVEEVKSKAEKKLNLAADEDARLADKQKKVEELINQGGDFRSVEAHTKELNGYVKRRTTLVDELASTESELTKTEALLKQLNSLISKTKQEEETFVMSFKRDGGDLQRSIAEIESQKARAKASLSSELLTAYEKSFNRNGGIAISKLDGARCSSCRSVIDECHLSQIKHDAPVAKCPSCSRLLIVK